MQCLPWFHPCLPLWLCLIPSTLALCSSSTSIFSVPQIVMLSPITGLLLKLFPQPVILCYFPNFEKYPSFRSNFISWGNNSQTPQTRSKTSGMDSDSTICQYFIAFSIVLYQIAICVTFPLCDSRHHYYFCHSYIPRV